MGHRGAEYPSFNLRRLGSRCAAYFEICSSPSDDLEAIEDSHGIWRNTVAAALAGDYQRLFARIDLQVTLLAPSFEVVQGWRTEQELMLRVSTGRGMTDKEVGRFISYYERLTRDTLRDAHLYSDVLIKMDEHRNYREIYFNPKADRR